MKTADYQHWKFYASFYLGSKGAIALSVLGAIIMSLCILPVTYLIRYVVDKIIPSGDIRMLLIVGAGLLFLNVTIGLIALWMRFTSLRVTKKATQELRMRLLERIHLFSRTHYTQLDLKALHSYLVTDTERLDNLGQALVMRVIPSLITAVLLVTTLIVLNWVLFTVLAAIVPFVLLVNRAVGKKAREKTRRFQDQFRLYSADVLFSLQVLDLTWILGVEAYQLAKQRKRVEELKSTGLSMNWFNTAYTEVNGLATASMAVLILIIGGLTVVYGGITIGALLSFFVVVAYLRSTASTLADAVPQLIAGNDSLLKLHEILTFDDSPPYTGTKKIEFSGSVSFEHVSFGYGERLLLSEISFQVKPMEIVAIIGANGSGKSTLIHLLLGFYRPDAGNVMADGHRYDVLDIRHIRRMVGVVPQDPFFFPGTIRDNIVFGHPEASSNQVEAAARASAAHAFVQDLPAGYDTLVGENGLLLSGGQRQRIAIARALLLAPKLLILDEPTNNLDAAGIDTLIESLTLRNDRPAILLVSHDPEIIARADRVYLLEDGYLRAVDPIQAGSNLGVRKTSMGGTDE